MASSGIKIVKGSDVLVTVQLIDKNSCTQSPFSLTGFTGCTGYFDQQDSDTALAATGSLVSADLGKVQIPLSETQTDLLEAGEELDFEVVVEKGSDTIIAQILGKLEVRDRLF